MRRFVHRTLNTSLLPLVAGAALAVTAVLSAAAAQLTPLATFDAAWQAIRDTYVDDAISEQEWQRLHERFRARAAEADDDAALRPVLRELLTALGRSHFELVPGAMHERLTAASAAGDAGDAGIEVSFVDGDLLVTRVEASGPAHEGGIRRGWALEAVDGLDLKALAPTSDAGVEPPQAFRLWATATALLRGPVGSRAELRVRDGENRLQTVGVERRRQAGEPVKFGHLPTFFARVQQRRLTAPGGELVAYVHFNVWMTPIAASLDRAFAEARNASGVVLDLRQNPGGVLTMLMGVSGHFLDQRLSLGTLRMRDSELKLMANPRFVAPDGSPMRPYTGKLAVLVDSSSYSASEIFAGGMQSLRRARVFGMPSPGGALPAMFRRLPNGDILEYAIGDFVTATGERIEGRGVIPDEIVPFSRAALLAGDDPPLAAALAWISEQASASGPAAESEHP